MLHLDRPNRIAVAVQRVARLQLERVDRIAETPEDAPQGREQVVEPDGPGDDERQFPAPEREGLEHAGEAEVMVGVEVCDQDLGEIDEPDLRPQELPLRAFRAVDEDPVAAAPDKRRSRGSLSSRSRARRPKEHDVEVHAPDSSAGLSPPLSAGGTRQSARSV